MARLEDIGNERLRALAHRVANAAGIGFNLAYRQLVNLLQRENDIPATDDIRKQLDAIFHYLYKRPKGHSWYNVSWHRELVTRRSPRTLRVAPVKPSRKYRRIRRRKEKQQRRRS